MCLAAAGFVVEPDIPMPVAGLVALAAVPGWFVKQVGGLLSHALSISSI